MASIRRHRRRPATGRRRSRRFRPPRGKCVRPVRRRCRPRRPPSPALRSARQGRTAHPRSTSWPSRACRRALSRCQSSRRTRRERASSRQPSSTMSPPASSRPQGRRQTWRRKHSRAQVRPACRPRLSLRRQNSTRRRRFRRMRRRWTASGELSRPPLSPSRR